MFLLPVMCPRCGCEIKKVERKRKIVDKIVGQILCSTCRDESLDKMRERERSEERISANSQRMIENNPMVLSATTRAKMVSTKTGIKQDPEDFKTLKKDRIPETRSEMSERMKLSNPMFDKATVAVMISTVRTRIKSGDIVYKKGQEHHLWKGNRDFNNACRRDLYPVWVFPILQRDNFSCTMCGSTKHLQVHHVRPLREFVEVVRIKYNIDKFSNHTADELYPIVQEVIAMHKLEDGITVCPDCHYEIDEKYFFKKDHNED